MIKNFILRNYNKIFYPTSILNTTGNPIPCKNMSNSNTNNNPTPPKKRIPKTPKNSQKSPNNKISVESETITEGSIKIANYTMVDGEKVKQKVFYNPVQVFNRDLSLLVTLTHAQTIRDERL
jgi:hypothetical protein